MDFSVHTVIWELYSWTAKESSWWAWSDKVWLLPAGFGVMSHGSYASLEGSNGSELPVNDHQLTLSVCSQVPMVGITSIRIVSYHHSYSCYLTLPLIIVVIMKIWGVIQHVCMTVLCYRWWLSNHANFLNLWTTPAMKAKIQIWPIQADLMKTDA